MEGQHKLVGAQRSDRHQVLVHIHTATGVQIRVDDKQAVHADQQGVAIGGRARNELGSHLPLRTNLVVNNDRLARTYPRYERTRRQAAYPSNGLGPQRAGVHGETSRQRQGQGQVHGASVSGHVGSQRMACAHKADCKIALGSDCSAASGPVNLRQEASRLPAAPFAVTQRAKSCRPSPDPRSITWIAAFHAGYAQHFQRDMVIEPNKERGVFRSSDGGTTWKIFCIRGAMPKPRFISAIPVGEPSTEKQRAVLPWCGRS